MLILKIILSFHPDNPFQYLHHNFFIQFFESSRVELENLESMS